MFSRLPGRWPTATTWLAWLLPVFAWAPLTYPGYFEFLSGLAPIFNLNDLMRHGLAGGWTPAVGRGYDLLRSDGSLPYLLAALPRGLGLSGAASIKLVFAAALLAGSFGMYGWARRGLGDWAGLLAAAVYTFWPFGLATVYVRGALGEALLLGLLPLAWWAAAAAAGGHRRAAPALALTLAAAWWSQAGLAVWLTVASAAYLLMARRGRAAWPALAGWAGGAALGLLGLAPAALAHRGLGGAGYVNFADHFVYLHQLLQAGWDLGPSRGGPYDGLSFQLGLVACGLALLGVVLWSTVAPDDSATAAAARGLRSPRFMPQPETDRGMSRGFAIAAALLPAALSLTLAAPLWQLLPFLSRTLTYPWQLLLLAGPWLAWLAGRGGLNLAGLLPAGEAPARDLAVAGAEGGAPDAGAAARAVTPSASLALTLFAALIGLALLGVYGDLNPPSTPVAVEQPVGIYGDNQLALVSAVVSPTVAGKVTVRVTWQALRDLDQDYTVFLHAEAPDGSVWGQQDTMPQGGKTPTSGWRPGALVEDQYTLALKPGAPPAIHYVLGLYQWQTGQRLPTAGDDKVVLKGPDD